MPSRKKAKGKARKAAKEAKAKEEESRVVATAASLQMQWLINSAASPTFCMHGCPLIPPGEVKICQDFINAYIDVCASRGKLRDLILAAYDATKDEYADVYSSKLDTVISMLLCNGTQYVLDGDNGLAKFYAVVAFHFEEWAEIVLHQTKTTTCNWGKIHELAVADDNTLVSYYRKRIPCSCLDEKYKEVKSVKKMGLCYNSKCSHPKKMVERSKMLCCTRCGAANYCSITCQKNHWKEHKMFCNEIAEKKAAVALRRSCEGCPGL